MERAVPGGPASVGASDARALQQLASLLSRQVLSSAASLPGPERPPSGADGSQGGEVNGAR